MRTVKAIFSSMTNTNSTKSQSPSKSVVLEIEQLRERAEACWDMAVDTAETHGPDAERLARAEADRDAALELWDAAIEALATGDRAAAADALESARALAAEWGEDADERAALAAVQS